MAMTSPISCMRIAIAVVFPPGAAHMSNIRSPFWGSEKYLKEYCLIASKLLKEAYYKRQQRKKERGKLVISSQSHECYV